MSADSFEVFVASVPGAGKTINSVTITSFSSPTLVQLISSGFITAVGPGGPFSIGPWGQYNGSFGCLKNSLVEFGGTVSTFNCNGLMSTDTVSRIVTMQGTVVAKVNQGRSDFTYSGTREFTLRVPRPHLVLTSRDSVVSKGVDPDTVRFFASWSPTHLTTSVIPAQLVAWRWKPDTASQAINVTSQCLAAAVANTCKRPITESGTMYVDMRLNGHETTESLHVACTTLCNTGNSMLDSEEVQQGLSSLFSASLIEGLEKGGWIRQRSDSTFWVDPFPSTWKSTGCGIDPPTGTMPPADAVTWVHTHPWSKGEKMKQCPGVKIGGTEVKLPYNGSSSSDDDNATQVWGPGWILDKDHVFEFLDAMGTVGHDHSRCGY